MARIAYIGQPNDGDTITVNGAVFEFDDNATVTPGHTAVAIGMTPADTYGALATAVTAQTGVAAAPGGGEVKLSSTGPVALTVAANNATASAVARDGDLCGGAIVASAVKTFVNGKLVARFGDKVTPHGTGPHAAATMVGCSATVIAEGKGVCRFGDAATCGHVVSTASPNVNAGD